MPLTEGNKDSDFCFLWDVFEKFKGGISSHRLNKDFVLSKIKFTMIFKLHRTLDGEK